MYIIHIQLNISTQPPVICFYLHMSFIIHFSIKILSHLPEDSSATVLSYTVTLYSNFLYFRNIFILTPLFLSCDLAINLHREKNSTKEKKKKGKYVALFQLFSLSL